MTNFETKDVHGENPSQESAPVNPNSVGKIEVAFKQGDVLMSPELVYRSVKDEGAITDLLESGVVRNKQSAGVAEKSRWGDRVFWSQGQEERYHNIQPEGFLIVAPYSVASQRQVRREDLVAIYYKDQQGEVSDRLVAVQQKEAAARAEAQQHTQDREQQEQERIQEILDKLGVTPKKDEPEK